jgi:death-on-curing protein
LHLAVSETDALAQIDEPRVTELLRSVRPATPAPKQGCVEGAIGNAIVATAYHTDSDEPDAIHVASFLLRSLAQNHCYEDGNKRAAWLACLEVLAVMGLVTIDADEDAAADLVERAAKSLVTVDAIARWIAEHLVPLP